MDGKKMKTYSLDQVKNKVVGKKGSLEREIYEKELELNIQIISVSNCNCDEDKQLDEETYKIEHLINDTYQVIGETSGTVWKQGTLYECNEWLKCQLGYCG